MGTNADMTDRAVPFQLPHILHKFSVYDSAELFYIVNKMDHSQINIIGLHPRQQIFKSRLHLRQLPRSDILSVFPCGTNMSLDDPLLSPAFDRKTDIGTDIRL